MLGLFGLAFQHCIWSLLEKRKNSPGVHGCVCISEHRASSVSPVWQMMDDWPWKADNMGPERMLQLQTLTFSSSHRRTHSISLIREVKVKRCNIN